MRRLSYIIISVLLVGGVVWFFAHGGGKKSTEVNFFGVTETTASGDTSQTSNVSSATASSTSGTTAFGPTHTYTNSTYHFSLQVPDDTKPSEFDDAAGDSSGHTILIQDKSLQLQIYVSTFDEDITLTKERILADVPDLVMQNQTTVTVGGVGAVAFTTTDNGQTYRQIWFVHKGHLYQTLSPAKGDALVGPLMQTWSWQ